MSNNLLSHGANTVVITQTHTWTLSLSFSACAPKRRHQFLSSRNDTGMSAFQFYFNKVMALVVPQCSCIWVCAPVSGMQNINTIVCQSHQTYSLVFLEVFSEIWFTGLMYNRPLKSTAKVLIEMDWWMERAGGREREKDRQEKTGRTRGTEELL